MTFSLKIIRHCSDRRLWAFALLFATATGVGCGSASFSQDPLSLVTRSPASSGYLVEPFLLEQEIGARRKRVAEFQFLNEYGKKIPGLRVFGAGGTAVGYASYVRQNLESDELKRLGKPLKHFKSRFAYEYYDIFHSSADADLVIDLADSAGNPLSVEDHEKAARALEAVLQETYGHLKGRKSAMEIRFLRVDRGLNGEVRHQDALLGFNFQNQHTDSYSTGLVELTDPPRGQSVIRDVKRWDSKENVFLEDLAWGKIRFYYEPQHAKTMRASKTINSEILPVIHFFTKAFQYGAKIPAEEEAKVLPLIRAFHPAETSTEESFAKQIRRKGLELYWNAIDVERANLELSRVGLLQKLIAYGKLTDGSVKEFSQKLAVWLSRKPLPTFPIGKGPTITDAFPGYQPSFKTAAKLGITVVAHETDEYLAFENITRSASGFPNVFLSVSSQEGQQAEHGDGWYTKIGEEGTRHTGLTVRTRVPGEMIEGIDFYVYEGTYAIFRNRTQLQVIEADLSMTPFEFVSMLLSPNGIERSNRARFEFASRQVDAQSGRLSPAEKKKIQKLLLQNIDRFDSGLLEIWGRLTISKQFPEVIELLLKKGTVDDSIVEHVLSRPPSSKHPEWVQQLLQKGELDGEIASYVFPQPHWSGHPEWVDQLLKKGTADWEISTQVLPQLDWSVHPEWVSQLLKKGKYSRAIIENVLTQPAAVNHPEWIEYLLQRGTSDERLADSVLPKTFWLNHPVLRAISNGAPPTLENLRAGISDGRFKREIKNFRRGMNADCKSLLNSARGQR